MLIEGRIIGREEVGGWLSGVRRTDMLERAAVSVRGGM